MGRTPVKPILSFIYDPTFSDRIIFTSRGCLTNIVCGNFSFTKPAKWLLSGKLSVTISSVFVVIVIVLINYQCFWHFSFAFLSRNAREMRKKCTHKKCCATLLHTTFNSWQNLKRWFWPTLHNFLTIKPCEQYETKESLIFRHLPLKIAAFVPAGQAHKVMTVGLTITSKQEKELLVSAIFSDLRASEHPVYQIKTVFFQKTSHFG